MELGNMIQGNSRGQFKIPRRKGWEDQLERICIATMEEAYIGYPNEFENDVFWIFPYYWNDCECEENNNYPDQHKIGCLMIKDNFHFKSTGFGIQWYKYPMRDSYMSKDITVDHFTTIIDKCLASLKEKRQDT